jgi:ribonuclease HII
LNPRWIIGVDEAGRGPLAGPVVAAAVVLDPLRAVAGLKDSKKLSALQRDKLAIEIHANVAAHSVALASPAEIDKLNILKATLLAMHRAVRSIQDQLGFDEADVLVLVDGNRLPAWPYPAQAIIKGDAKEPAISAASILAKTHRDRLLMDLHHQHPAYGFDAHMGYPTPLHLERLLALGPCAEHRTSFAPVRQALACQQGLLFKD